MTTNSSNQTKNRQANQSGNASNKSKTGGSANKTSTNPPRNNTTNR